MHPHNTTQYNRTESQILYTSIYDVDAAATRYKVLSKRSAYMYYINTPCKLCHFYRTSMWMGGWLLCLSIQQPIQQGFNGWIVIWKSSNFWIQCIATEGNMCKLFELNWHDACVWVLVYVAQLRRRAAAQYKIIYRFINSIFFSFFIK